jgi:transposase
MHFQRISMLKFNEIQRLIDQNLSDREIARTLNCRRKTAAVVRQGLFQKSDVGKTNPKQPPVWAAAIHWGDVEKDLKKGFEIYFIWEAYAKEVVSYSYFFKYLRNRFNYLFRATVTLREFAPGSQAEVDYAGDKILWVDKDGHKKKAPIFVGCLCYSQLVFAWAAEDEKKENWLLSHHKMFEFFGGVPQVIVCDQLKNGVLKSHRYDPDLNPDYIALARHYGTAIVPARVRRPKDKALGELAVKLIQRLFRFKYRNYTFRSLEEINQALLKTAELINTKIHSRFKTARRERFEKLERAALKALPHEPFEYFECYQDEPAMDCTISVKRNFYSVPHVYRGKKVSVKVSANHVEVFANLDRIAYHNQIKGKVGMRVIHEDHLPENSKAYREATPQKLLCQARFIHLELYQLVTNLFQKDALGNIRRVQGLLRVANKANNRFGTTTAEPWIKFAIEKMNQFNRYRVQEFEDWIKSAATTQSQQEEREIYRMPGNPMLRSRAET